MVSAVPVFLVFLEISPFASYRRRGWSMPFPIRELSDAGFLLLFPDSFVVFFLVGFAESADRRLPELQARHRRRRRHWWVFHRFVSNGPIVACVLSFLVPSSTFPCDLCVGGMGSIVCGDWLEFRWLQRGMLGSGFLLFQC